MDKKTIIQLLLLLMIASYAFLFKDEMMSILKDRINPCPTPVTYSISEVDAGFNISKDDFLLAVKEAEALWESASSRDLFEYSENGEMKVSLIYDERQESTSQMNYLDNSLQQDNNYYLSLKSQYNSLLVEYNNKKQELNVMVSSYNQRLSEYEKDVNIWNKKRNSQSEYNRLNEEKVVLENIMSQINAKRSEVNAMAEQINQMVARLNQLATELNLDIAEYNDVVSSADQEFEQGNYVYGPDSREINIYQFENRGKLVRVLAHELGHALGIDHLNDPEDIMYPYNIGENRSITSADLYELGVACPAKY